jgi:2-polyprenyl-6-hydroxyphenyl methylase/3-demethylubiquinone-9 3-methyltransferase
MSDQNIDKDEIQKFEALASRWWDKESKFKPLHDINPLRANWIDSRSPVAKNKILDVGCGGGILSESMAQRGADVTGIDMGDAPLAVAKLHSLETGIKIKYKKCTVESLAAESAEQYDVITCLEMLEHVPDPSSVVAACADLTKPGGTVFFSTINRNPKSYLLGIIGIEYVLQMLPKRTHEFSKFIKPSELTSWVRAAGLELVNITGLLYNPILKTYKLSEHDVDVNYMIYARKPK